MNIIVTDDSPEYCHLFKIILENAGYTQVHIADSAEQTLILLAQLMQAGEGIDLILLDAEMTGTDGVAACRLIKEQPEYHDVAIIIITNTHEGTDLLETAFAAGAMDYLTKPLNRIELLARVRSALRLKQEMDQRRLREIELLKLTQQLEDSNQQLESANAKLQLLSNLDGLTGIHNRRYFDDMFQQEWKREKRSHTSLALLMIDIDYFKRYNDTYGHQQGDDCLKQVATALSTYPPGRPGDIVARYGGEEFVVLLTNTPAEGVYTVAEALRHKIEQLQIPHSASTAAPYITISLGGSVLTPGPETQAEILLEAADKALYRAKASGRNCSVLTEA